MVCMMRQWRMNPLVAFVSLAVWAPLGAAPVVWGATPEAMDIGSRLELFVDHHLIIGMKGTQLKLHNPQCNQLVFTFDQPWEGPQSAYVSILKDGDEFRMYYRGGGDLVREHTCLAVSKDATHWTRPSFGLIEFEGSKANNIIWTGPDKAYSESHNFSPFIDTNPACKPSERYKAVSVTRVFSKPDERKNVLIGFTSPDGIRWKRVREEPLITEGGFDSHNTMFWDERLGKYVCYSRMGQKGKRSVSRCLSDDFLNWTKPVLLDFGDTEPEHFYTNGIVPYFRAPHLYLGFPMRFVPSSERKTVGFEQRETDGLSDAVLISSRDGMRWDRTFMEAFIRPGLDPLNWGGAHSNQTPTWGIVPADEHRIAVYWLEHEDNYPNRRQIPRLRRGFVRTDGFVSVNAPYTGGEMVTCPLVFAGKKLALNMSTSAVGSVRVQIEDAAGRPIPGFSITDCPAFWGDEIERVVAWKGGHDVSRLAGRPVRLRFVMKDADLYAIRFQP